MVRLVAVVVSVFVCVHSASASRVEDAGMMQLREMGSEISQIDKLRSLQDTVKGMAKSKSGAKIPDSAVNAVNQIQFFLNKTLVLLGQEATDAQTGWDKENEKFTTASDTYDTQLGYIIDEQSDASQVSHWIASRATHFACRSAESTLWTNKYNCDLEEATLLATYNGKVSAVVSASAGGVHSAVCEATEASIREFQQAQVDDVTAYATAISEMMVARANYNAKVIQCTANTTAWQNKQTECDADQRTAKGKSCTYAGAINTENADYDILYDAYSGQWNIRSAELTEENENRVAQCKLVKLVQCYIEGLESKDDDAELAAAIETCDSEAEKSKYETACETKFSVTIGELPERHTLTNVPDTVCSNPAVYLSNDEVFPANTHALNTTEVSCPCEYEQD